jgi:alcohol dehydrogenase class IV
MELIGNWNYPTSYQLGAGRINGLADGAHSLGMQRPLVVTDPVLAAFGFLQDMHTSLNMAGLGAQVFADIKANPTGKNVADGVAAYRAGGHDGVIAVGGGSALDAGKAIALIAGQSGTLWDYVGEGDNWQKIDADAVPPIIAVPTTAGTGSEVGRASVITDDEAHIKKIVFHPKMMPALVIADPELTLGLPAGLTAATGMDALSHNLEAYCAPGYHPMAVGISVEGMRLVHDWLPTAFKDGSNLEARTHMLVASSMGATAFQRGLGAMHALAHPLGALYNAHHGTLNAVLMPYVLIANRSVIEDRISDLTRMLGFDKIGFTPFLDWVLEMRSSLGMPHTLADLGIDDSRAELVGQMAAVDPTAGTNPIQFDAVAYRDIFQKSVRGAL